MQRDTQISATVSPTTRDRLDRFTERHGLKKNHVVEQALLFYMESRRELPEEAFIPTRIVLENEAFSKLEKLIETPPPPTRALRDLMRGS